MLQWGRAMFGLMEDPQFTMKQSLMAIYDPHTKQVIPEGTASLVVWAKATVRSVYPGKEGHLPPINVKWNNTDEADGMLHI